MDQRKFDVIIIGGSYAGLSAAMALGRSLRRVLVIDAGKPCNRQTPHSHNFLTQDGKTPSEIAVIAREQVEKYDTVSFLSDYAVQGRKTDQGFEISTEKGEVFEGTKLIFATGVKDLMPPIPGFVECWGISVIHCPYCHGYEVRGERTGVLANGEFAFEYAKMITNWTKDLTLFTQGESSLAKEQAEKLMAKGVKIIKSKIAQIEHADGKLTQVHLEDGSKVPLAALYAKTDFVQSSDIPLALGCTIAKNGYLEVDFVQKTNIPGVFACGDSTNMFRTVSYAVSAGTMAGAACNKELIDEEF
ncbi:NAD(P)/FAD-dependent oxidoreductase [Algoriphagus terrigena]|uniref:NAD(P)/FAD-dependent oxidoreductase n=1 Tax=Algoriphagus terrigena TaxID=344884 RepID=UPI0004119A6F|nr:NAD(P)/FAD-dependent oxidoreductase [Algoriphagus terrigena]